MKPKPTIVMTASWFTQLPETHAPIGISRGVPRGRSGYKRYDKLAPGPWFRSVSVEEYTRRYNDEVLGALDPENVIRELEVLAEGGIPTLLCWEPQQPGEQWCHRGMVSQWLHRRMGLEVFELGFEQEGCGDCHPKLHPDNRRLVND